MSTTNDTMVQAAYWSSPSPWDDPPYDRLQFRKEGTWKQVRQYFSSRGITLPEECPGAGETRIDRDTLGHTVIHVR